MWQFKFDIVCKAKGILRPFKHWFHKMFKRTQTILWLIPNWVSVFDHFVGSAFTDLVTKLDIDICSMTKGILRPFKHWFHKMFTCTQTILWLIPNWVSVFDHFVGSAFTDLVTKLDIDICSMTIFLYGFWLHLKYLVDSTTHKIESNIVYAGYTLCLFILMILP